MKAEALIGEMDSFYPADFFICKEPIFYSEDKSNFMKKGRKNNLPDFSDLLAEEPFFTLSISWNEDCLMGYAVVEKPFESSFFPDYAKGDSLEVFIDTRDNKEARFASSFCHAFVFFAKETEGALGAEVTRFRLEDSHPICDPADILVESTVEKESYKIFFSLPSAVLHGYDPSQFDRLGFACRVHRYKGPSGHFPVSSKAFDPLQNPSLWASLTLVK